MEIRRDIYKPIIYPPQTVEEQPKFKNYPDYFSELPLGIPD